jgi:hypothetical protein
VAPLDRLGDERRQRRRHDAADGDPDDRAGHAEERRDDRGRDRTGGGREDLSEADLHEREAGGP